MFTVTIIWHWNGIYTLNTPDPWSHVVVYDNFYGIEADYNGKPWTSRRINADGDILIITSEGTLD